MTLKRWGNASRPVRVSVVAAVTALAMLAVASSAMATPKGIFAKYSDCPTKTPGVVLCTFGQTTSGEFSIGSTKVTINKTITLQGGGISTGVLNEYFLVPAVDGNSLSKTELNVGGGLAGLINCEEIKGSGLWEVIERASCKAIFENSFTGVTATTEIAATPTNPPILNLLNLAFEEGTAITLPVKVHLKNPLLGETCYIGSEAHPVQLHLTTGKSGTLTGKSGSLIEEEEKGFVSVKLHENSLVDNTYTAPASEGCGGFFSFLIGPIINSKIGLPSAAGKSKAVLNGDLNTAETSAVVASESF
jgi:hypothetical protein